MSHFFNNSGLINHWQWDKHQICKKTVYIGYYIGDTTKAEGTWHIEGRGNEDCSGEFEMIVDE